MTKLFCIDCEHYGRACNIATHLCYHLGSISIITGEVEPVECKAKRSDVGSCGADGGLFVLRVVKPRESVCCTREVIVRHDK